MKRYTLSLFALCFFNIAHCQKPDDSIPEMRKITKELDNIIKNLTNEEREECLHYLNELNLTQEERVYLTQCFSKGNTTKKEVVRTPKNHENENDNSNDQLEFDDESFDCTLSIEDINIKPSFLEGILLKLFSVYTSTTRTFSSGKKKLTCSFRYVLRNTIGRFYKK